MRVQNKFHFKTLIFHPLDSSQLPPAKVKYFKTSHALWHPCAAGISRIPPRLS